MLLDIVTALAILPGGAPIAIGLWAVFLGSMWAIREGRGAR